MYEHKSCIEIINNILGLRGKLSCGESPPGLLGHQVAIRAVLQGERQQVQDKRRTHSFKVAVADKLIFEGV